MKAARLTHAKFNNAMQSARRDRHETAVQIRKAKQEERLKMKRMVDGGPATFHATTLSIQNGKENAALPQPIPSAAVDSTHSSDAELLTQALKLFTEFLQPHSTISTVTAHETLRGVRRLLCRADRPPVEQVVNLGLLPPLVAFLQATEAPELVFEAEWALTNVTSTRFARAAIGAGAIPPLARNLCHGDPAVRLQAAWCLGNVAGEGAAYRDGLLALPEVLHGLIENLKDPHSADLLQNVAWAVSGLCRGKPRFAAVQPFVQPLTHALVRLRASGDTSEADKIRIDIVWALSYLAELPDGGVEALIEAGAVAELVAIIERMPRKALLMPAVRAVGNVSVGTDAQTDRLVEAGFLDHAAALLSHPSKNIQKDTCWILSNLAAGTQQQIQLMFDQEPFCGLLSKVVLIALHSPFEVRKEAIWVLCNIIETGTDKHLCLLMEMNNAMDVFVDALKPSTDTTILILALHTLKKVFQRSQQLHLTYCEMFDERNGLDPLEDLQNHPSEEVYQLAVDILEAFFSAEEEEPDQNLAPVNAENTFSFGLSKNLFPATPQTFTFGTTTSNR